MPFRVPIRTAGLLIFVAYPCLAQQPLPAAAIPQVRFESWRPEALSRADVLPDRRLTTISEEGKNRWVIGGAIGAAVGIVSCTAMSTLLNDSARGGLSFCPLDTYLIMGGAGFVVGAVIGAVM